MNSKAALLAFLQVVSMLVLTPFLIGLTRQVRSRLEGRVGAGIGQPWRDIRKQLSKEPLRAPGISWVQATGPIILMMSSLLLCALIPLIGTTTSPGIPNDLFVVVGILLLGTIALALIGLDAGTAFGGMGSSRHMTIAAMVEPTVLIAVYALSIPIGSSELSQIVNSRIAVPLRVAAPVSLLALVALTIAVIAETSRMPVDNPSTHLELTMIHEAMILESSARDLAWLELGSWLRLEALLGLIASLSAPIGLAITVNPISLLFGVVALILKLSFMNAALAAVEVFLAKLRLFRVPELLAGSFVLALLAVTASYLTVRG